MYSEIIPLHAQGLFIVHLSGLISQFVIYDYYDPDEYYASLEDELLYEELNILANNMQEFLNREKVIINGEKVKPKVELVDISFKGETTRPSILFFIEFKGKFKKGVNIYENYYESEKVEYDYEVYWIFPQSVEIVEVDVDGDVEILDKRKLIVRVLRDTKVRGYEKIVFKI